MRKRLPPLFSLQVFEAAARHGKFSLAAEELALTQSAVSRQIKQLEDWYGHALFNRSGPRIELSQEGLSLVARLSAPLHSLHNAFYTEEHSTVQHLHINTLASIADSLLIPNVEQFRTAHPQISLCIQADYALHSLPPQLPMIAIRYTTQANSELKSHRLLDDHLVVVGTPSLVRQMGNDLNAWPTQLLLRHSYMDWSAWTSDATVASHLQHALIAEGLEFNDALLLLNAAKHGLGLALTRLTLAWDGLQKGELVLASPHICASPLSYYLEYRHDCAKIKAVETFCIWIQNLAEVWKARQQNYLNDFRSPPSKKTKPPC